MDDDDLDLLLDSVDVDSLPAAAHTDMDMDDLLDDIADSLLGEGATDPPAASDAYCDAEEELDLGSHQQAMATKEWQSAIARVPADMRDRWARMFAGDNIDAAPRSRFRASDCYSGQRQAKATVQPKQLLQECVRKALKVSKSDDDQIREVLASLVSDHGRYDALVLLFEKELLREHVSEVKSDPNYVVSNERYKSLQAYCASEKM